MRRGAIDQTHCPPLGRAIQSIKSAVSSAESATPGAMIKQRMSTGSGL